MTRRTRRRRTRQEEAEEEEEQEEEGEQEEQEEEATDIKSNNPHLAGGEKHPSIYICLLPDLLYHVYSFGKVGYAVNKVAEKMTCYLQWTWPKWLVPYRL